MDTLELLENKNGDNWFKKDKLYEIELLGKLGTKIFKNFKKNNSPKNDDYAFDLFNIVANSFEYKNDIKMLEKVKVVKVYFFTEEEENTSLDDLEFNVFKDFYDLFYADVEEKNFLKPDNKNGILNDNQFDYYNKKFEICNYFENDSRFHYYYNNRYKEKYYFFTED